MIWACAGDANPTEDELERLWHACRRHGVIVLRVEGQGLLGPALWDCGRMLPFDPVAKEGRRWSIERWGPTIADALRGRVEGRARGVALAGEVSRGQASTVIHWPRTSGQTLAGAREMGIRTVPVGRLASVD